jgi:hypothetical protein
LFGVTLVALIVASAFFVGGYAATGSWNPWGHRHYYYNLDVNFGYCVTPAGGTTTCNAVHNVMFNTGVAWMDEITQKTTGTTTNGCFPSATCGMSFISLSNSAVTFAAGDAAFGATNGNCAAVETGAEITANGLARSSGTITILSGASGGTSTIVHTFTASATQGVQDACLVSFGTASSASNIELAAASFTAVTLNNLDTIQITWTLTWTWS